MRGGRGWRKRIDREGLRSRHVRWPDRPKSGLLETFSSSTSSAVWRSAFRGCCRGRGRRVQKNGTAAGRCLGVCDVLSCPAGGFDCQSILSDLDSWEDETVGLWSKRRTGWTGVNYLAVARLNVGREASPAHVRLAKVSQTVQLDNERPLADWEEVVAKDGQGQGSGRLV